VFAIELILIFVLVGLNGLLAGAEIAVVALRRTRVQQLVEEGRESAQAVLRLQEQPERFLATVQVGLTLVSSTAAAFGGARVADRLEPVIASVPVLEPYAPGLALSLVVLAVSFLSIVLGELVPKSLALRSAERYALVSAPILLGISWIAKPIVWFLTAASNLVLRPFHDSTTFTETRHSAEELQQLVEEAGESGEVDKQASNIASRALEFGSLTAADLMVPRVQIDAIPQDVSTDELRRILLEEGHSRMPVYEGSVDNVVGYIVVKDVLAIAWESDLIKLPDILRPVHYIPETAKASQVLQDFQRNKAQLAIVVDEHGVTAGLLTLEDLVEELVGELFSEHDEAEELWKRDGASAVVRGHAPIRELNRALDLSLPESESWTTIAGLASTVAGRIPSPGTKLELEDGTELEVVDATPRHVRLVRLTPKAAVVET